MSLDGKQQIITAAGLGLIGLDMWKGKTRSDLGAVLTSSPAAGAIGTAHKDLIGVAAELLFVGGLVLVAGMNDQLATAGVAIMLALLLLWLMLHVGGGNPSTGSAAHPSNVVPGPLATPGGTVAGMQIA